MLKLKVRVQINDFRISPMGEIDFDYFIEKTKRNINDF